MKNCKVTQYKKSVNNDALPIYGKAIVVVGANNPSLIFNKDGEMVVLGGSINGQTRINVIAYETITINSSDIVSDGTYGAGNIGLLVDKYNLTHLERMVRIDAADLASSPLVSFVTASTSEIQNPERLANHFAKTEFISFSINSNALEIDLTELGSNGTMVKIVTSGCRNVYGSLNKAGMSPLTTDFSVPNTKNVSLNIETFVGYQRAAGNTTGSLSIGWLGACNCTFNGAAVANQAENTLSWTATTITLNGTTITA